MSNYGIAVVIDPKRAEIGARRVENSLSRVDRAADSTQKMLTRAFGAFAISTTLVAGVRTLANFSQEMSTVRAITNATASEFVALRDEAKNLGATTRYSATQAGEAMKFLARAGFDASQVLKTVPDTLKLAQAGALDLGRAADIASNILTGFRGNVSEATRVIDVLALAANSANTDVSQLGDAMKYVAPVAAGMGIELEETTAAAMALSNAGMQATMAGTGLRRILSELESPAGKSQKILRSLGLTAADVKVSHVGLTNALKALAAAGMDTGMALEFFGDRGGPAFEILSSSIGQVEVFTKNLNNAAGTVDRISEVMDDNLNGALLAVKSSIEALVLSFGDLGAESSLTMFFRGLASGIRAVAKNLGKLTSIVTTGAAAWAAYFVAIKAQTFVTAAASALKYAFAVGSGNAVILGSAAAETQKAAALVASRQAEVEATRASLARIKAELEKAVVLRGSQTAEFARMATLKQVSVLEAQLATQTSGLAAAQTAHAAAAKKSTGVFAKLSMIFPGLTAGIRAFTAAIAANPIGAIAVGLTVAIGLLITFRDKIKMTSDGLSTFGDVLSVFWDRWKEGAGIVWREFKKLFDFIGPAFKAVFGDLELSFAGVLRGTARFIDYNVAFYTGMYHTVVEVFKAMPGAVAAWTQQAMKGLTRIIENHVSGLITKANKLLSAARLDFRIDDINYTIFEPQAETGGEMIAGAFNRGIDKGLDSMFLENWMNGLFDEAEALAKRRSAEAFDLNLEQYVPAPGTAGGASEIPTPDTSAFREYLKVLDKEADLLRMTSTERELATALMEAEKDISIELTAAQRAVLAGRLSDIRLLSQQADILETINGPIYDYIEAERALKDLLEAKTISQEQYNIALRDTALAKELSNVQDELDPGSKTAEIDALRAQMEERNEVLRQAREAELISTQEHLALLQESYKRYNDDLMKMELARHQVATSSASRAFDSMAKMTEAFAGKQSSAYRAMFLASKAFAVADTTIQITNALAKAANEKYPLNIAAMASVAALTAGLISDINSVTYTGGYQTGGSFKVGGVGGADSQLVAFRATPNETVSVRTPSQQATADRAEGSAPAAATPDLNVINVNDPAMLDDYLNSPTGEKTLVNMIQRNRSNLGI